VATVGLMLTAMPLASHAENIDLVCQGYVIKAADAGSEHTAQTVDVHIDLAASTMLVNGYWGCLGEQCYGALPVRITDQEVTYVQAGKVLPAETFKTSFVLTASINRYTGVFKSDNMMVAEKELKATWTVMMLGGRFQCAQQARRF